MKVLNHRSFPRAILHVDGDCFFASCEIAKDPSLRGKPVVTGQERGIASSMSYEAKARGVKRGMRLSEIKKVCPDVIILPSDYETYSLYSLRMYEIVRRYTADIEEYSIDECFADLTGMRRSLNMSYEEIARSIKHDLDTELGMTFSVGLGVNKVTAKIASKWKKPSGLTVIPGYMLREFLSKLPVEKVWGIGPNTSAFMEKLGIKTAYDFAIRDKEWVKEHFSKPFVELYQELSGEFIFPLSLGQKHDYKSISKTKTFTPPSSDKEFVFSQLSKNIESACIKLRRHDLFTKEIAFFLKTQEFRYSGLEIKLSFPVSVPQEIVGLVREKFNEVYRSGVLYRATGIVLMNLTHTPTATIDLFGSMNKIEKIKKIFDGIDKISEKYGKYSVFLGSSFKALHSKQHNGDRGGKTQRKEILFKGETERKRLGIPFLGKTV